MKAAGGEKWKTTKLLSAGGVTKFAEDPMVAIDSEPPFSVLNHRKYSRDCTIERWDYYNLVKNWREQKDMAQHAQHKFNPALIYTTLYTHTHTPSMNLKCAHYTHTLIKHDQTAYPNPQQQTLSISFNLPPQHGSLLNFLNCFDFLQRMCLLRLFSTFTAPGVGSGSGRSSLICHNPLKYI